MFPHTLWSTPLDFDTPHGLARVHLHPARETRCALVLGHGAGGSIDSRDLVTVSKVAGELGITVALVEQPYLVAGRKSPAPAHHLDAAWTSVIEQLELDAKLIVGGRSSGARVACRTAADTGAAGVLCLAFPVHPPGKPEKDRLDELDAVKVPTLVIQGGSDPFGMPPKAPARKVVTVRGNHTLADLDAVAQAARGWLASRCRS